MSDTEAHPTERILRTPPPTGLEGVKQFVATLRKKGIFTIPQEVRDAVRLHEGDNMIVTVEDDRIVLTPAAPVVPRDQAWFWTPEWQAKEREADEDLAAGRVTYYDSSEEFLASLDED